MSTRNLTFTFYLTPFRAWELALGAMLAVRFIPVPETTFWKNICGGAGLLLLLGVILLGSSAAPLLMMTSLACLGAALVIASSENGVSMAGRLLSLPLFVAIGLISYSLYLWHWPLIVFQRTDMLFGAESAASTKLTLIALSVGLAYLSWKLVELPFRSMAHRTSKVAVFGGASTAIGSTFALCALVLVVSGAPYRFSQRVVDIGAYLAYDSSAAFRTGRCFISANRQRFDAETCLKPDPARPNYLLVGDSHAAHLWSGLSVAMPQVNIMQATASECRPTVPEVARGEMKACRDLMEFAFDGFLANNHVDKVLLAASWKDEDLPNLSATLDILKSRGGRRRRARADRRVRCAAATAPDRRNSSRQSFPRQRKAHARNSRARSRHERFGEGARRDLFVGLRRRLPGRPLRRVCGSRYSDAVRRGSSHRQGRCRGGPKAVSRLRQQVDKDV